MAAKPKAEATIAVEDTFVPRPDLGPNMSTFIPAGYPFPGDRTISSG